MTDTIHNPAHYTVYPVQPIMITRYLGFCLGNVVKHVLRAPFKGGVEDIRKALRYIDWEIEMPMPLITQRVVWGALPPCEDLATHLMDEGTPLASLQVEFLAALSAYLSTGGGEMLRELRHLLYAMLADFENNMPEGERQ